MVNKKPVITPIAAYAGQNLGERYRKMQTCTGAATSAGSATHDPLRSPKVEPFVDTRLIQTPSATESESDYKEKPKFRDSKDCKPGYC